jgi:hypothetical protein
MPFVLGARGSAWAWRNGRWDSIDHFKRVQRKWAIWGVVLWIAAVALFGSLFGGIFYALGSSEAYKLAVSKLQANTVAMGALGAPISTGTPNGEISVKGEDSGEAKLDFSVSGTKTNGQLHVEATKKGGVWSLRVLNLKIDGRDDVIDLLKDSRVELVPLMVRSAA